VKDGIDPKTKRRHIEEIAFEVVSTQSRADVTKKAPKMIRRGVRRVFAVFLKTGTVGEWSRKKKDWIEMDRSSAIADRCLIEPLEVEALFDAAAADDAVARGLVARGNPVIEDVRQQGRAEDSAEGRAKGKAEGNAEAILRCSEHEFVAERGVAATGPGDGGSRPAPGLAEESRRRHLSRRDLLISDGWVGNAPSGVP
jgi:hypothetical protein